MINNQINEQEKLLYERIIKRAINKNKNPNIQQKLNTIHFVSEVENLKSKTKNNFHKMQELINKELIKQKNSLKERIKNRYSKNIKSISTDISEKSENRDDDFFEVLR